MHSIFVRLLNGEVFRVPYNETLPSVSSIRKQLYDHYVGEHGRNEIVNLFRYEDSSERDTRGSFLSDEDDLKLNSEEMLGMVITYESKMTPTENTNVENKLLMYFNNNETEFKEFHEAIINSEALIAGGSILSSFGNYKINDLDIYVHYSKAKLLLDKLKLIGYHNRMCNYFHQASQYDQSFFKKNNILARFVFYRQYRNNIERSIDIMIIPDHFPIENDRE